MKTPKEILFARHSPVEPKLDAMRQEVVAQVCDDRRRKQAPTATGNRAEGIFGFFGGLFVLKPQALAGLAAVWVMILALKLSTPDGYQVVVKKAALTQEAIAELRQQRLFFFELAGLREVSDAEPPKTSVPRPRSERRFDVFVT
jgi:hypothetical protein